MKTSTVLLAVIGALTIQFAYGGMEELQDCIKDFSSRMQSVIQQAMGGDASAAKDKMCPMMKDFLKCALRASSDKRPTDAELDDLKKQLSSSVQGMQSIDCDININQIADEVWNAAGVLRPLSLVALAVAAFAAIFLSKRM